MTQALRWLLDTNTVSEAIKLKPQAQVMQALMTHIDTVAIPVTVLQELRFGWLRMPPGRQKIHVGRYLHSTVERMPVLPLDATAARLQADLRADAQASGRPLSYPDSEIAAIALANGLTLVTRNTRDFEGRPGLRVANWFEP
jgi:tRNA(fMet)-specific endonuclease VapC